MIFSERKRTLKQYCIGLIIPSLVLVISLLITFELADEAHNTAQDALQSNFDARTREFNRRIQQRMQAYEQVLRGLSGLFAASDTVTRDEFHRYVKSLNLEQNYPGIQGLGYAVLIAPKNLAEHENRVRAEGFPDYQITPSGQRAIYSSIVYIEPFDYRNRRAFGYDMFSDPVRRAAMELARDTGMAAISGKVMLVQETGQDVQAGFLMYLPIYQTANVPDSVDERRNTLAGWVYAPFRMNDLMLKLHEEQSGDLDVEIYDGAKVSTESAMYSGKGSDHDSNASPLMRNVDLLTVAQRSWTVTTTALPSFAARFDFDRSGLIMRGGVSISLLLMLLTWLFLDDRARALRSAQQAMELALYDTLTGLPNRKLITERLGQALVTARREKFQVALMFIDLDKFKPVNDEYGHAMGDLLLKEVALRLEQSMRRADTAARLGGDEFVILLPHIDGRHGAEVVGAKILEELNRPFEIAGHTFHISGSIGVAFFPDDATDEKMLVRYADAAMYHAKHKGRNGMVFYEPSLRIDDHR